MGLGLGRSTVSILVMYNIVVCVFYPMKAGINNSSVRFLVVSVAVTCHGLLIVIAYDTATTTVR